MMRHDATFAADRFLSAGVALGILVRDGGRYANAPDAQHYLVYGAETDLSAYLRWQNEICYPAWLGFSERLREWQPGCPKADAQRSTANEAAAYAAFARAHHSLALLLGEAMCGAVDLSEHQNLLDLGGGSGAASIALCRRHPGLRATVLERPEIAAVAREFVAENGLADRIDVREADYVREPLPSGFDAALLSNLMSLSSPDQNRALLRRVYEALPVGGIVILCGWILDDDRDVSLLRTLFCLDDIRWGSPDVERCAETYSGWLRDAGFTGIRRSALLEPASVMIGRKIENR